MLHISISTPLSPSRRQNWTEQQFSPILENKVDKSCSICSGAEQFCIDIDTPLLKKEELQYEKNIILTIIRSTSKVPQLEHGLVLYNSKINDSL